MRMGKHFAKVVAKRLGRSLLELGGKTPSWRRILRPESRGACGLVWRGGAGRVAVHDDAARDCARAD